MRVVNDSWREFDVAVGGWRLDEVMAEALPVAAVKALVTGCDTPSLRELAAMEGSGWSEIEPILARVLEERGHSLPTEDEALKSVADGVLRQLVSGEVEPEAATTRLRHLAWRVANRPAWEDLDVFVGLSSNWDSVAHGHLDRDAVRQDVLREAQALLARGGVRTS
jgi:hypothetical protein